MSVRLEKLNFKTFYKNRNEMWNLLDSNRERIAPWFWWADTKVTPTKASFYRFMVAYLADTKRKEITHNLLPLYPFDEQFLMFKENGSIGGIIGLDHIDTCLGQDAELWRIAFKGTHDILPAVRIIEDYCANTLHLTSFYANVQTTNRASRISWERYGYNKRILLKNVPVSQHNSKVCDMYRYLRVFNSR